MMTSQDPLPLVVLVDADACPVKNEIYRVAGRHGIKTYVVSNSFFQVPRDPLIERVVVAEGMDKADDWIAERARPGAVVITADIPLAGRCVKAGASVLSRMAAPLTAIRSAWRWRRATSWMICARPEPSPADRRHSRRKIAPPFCRRWILRSCD